MTAIITFQLIFFKVSVRNSQGLAASRMARLASVQVTSVCISKDCKIKEMISNGRFLSGGICSVMAEVVEESAQTATENQTLTKSVIVAQHTRPLYMHESIST